MTVDDILQKDLLGDQWLTEEELRFLMSVTNEEDLQKIYEDNLEIGDICEEQLKSGGVRKYKIINLSVF